MDWTPELAERFKIPPKHRTADITRLPDRQYRQIICNYIKNLRKNLDSGIGLYLYGDYGRGKSALATIILYYVAEIGKTGLFLKCKRVPDLVINEYPFDDECLWKDRVRMVDLLVIDEFLVCDDKRDRYVEDIVRDRSDSGLTTVMTSNESPASLKIKFKSFANVIRECMVAVLVEGCDFRALKNQEIRRRVKDEN